MAIRKFRLRRGREVPTTGKPYKPFYFFKGSEKELAVVSHEEIADIFKKLELDLPKEHFNGLAEALKKNAIRVVEYMSEQSINEYFFDLGYTKEEGALKHFLRPTKKHQSVIRFRIKKGKNGRILIHPETITHDILAHDEIIDNFDRLKEVLREGFVGTTPPNVITARRRKITGHGWKNPTYGDRYGVEIMKDAKISYHPENMPEDAEQARFVQNVRPEHIVRINIELNTKITKAQHNALWNDKTLDTNAKIEKEKALISELNEQKKKFYREELKGWPIHFIEY